MERHIVYLKLNLCQSDETGRFCQSHARLTAREPAISNPAWFQTEENKQKESNSPSLAEMGGVALPSSVFCLACFRSLFVVRGTRV